MCEVPRFMLCQLILSVMIRYVLTTSKIYTKTGVTPIYRCSIMLNAIKHAIILAYVAKFCLNVATYRDICGQNLDTNQ